MAAHRYWRINNLTTPPGGYTTVAEIELRASKGGADETGSGTASASSSYSGMPASNAVDNNTGTAWTSADNTGPEWWKYDFGSGSDKDIVEVAMTPLSGYHTRTPHNFNLEYSDDDSDWTILLHWHYTWPNANQVVFNDENDIAPVLQVFNIFSQAAYDEDPKLKLLNISAQAAYEEDPKLKVQWIFAQAAYSEDHAVLVPKPDDLTLAMSIDGGLVLVPHTPLVVQNLTLAMSIDDGLTLVPHEGAVFQGLGRFFLLFD